MIQVYQRKGSGVGFTFAGEWIDDLDTTPSIKEKVDKEQQRQLDENVAKRSKTNEGEAQNQVHKEAKIPKPGQGAPTVYQYIRNLKLSRDDTWLFACTDSDKAVVMFKIDLSDDINCLKLVKRQVLPKRPNAITTSMDDKQLIVADKFGDLYSFDINDLQPLAALEPTLGHVSLLTDVEVAIDSDGKQYIFTSDRDEHIRITHFPQSFVIDKWLFGHKEFISTLCLPVWSPELLFSAGGDSFIYSWNWQTGNLLHTFSFGEIVKPYLTDAHLAPERFQNEKADLIEYSVADIVTFDSFPFIAFFVEATKAVIFCSVDRDTGKISLTQVLELPYNIISLTCAEAAGELIATLDNRDSDDKDFVVFIACKDEKFSIDHVKSQLFNNLIVETLKSNSIANVTKQNIYPLYHVASLRKRGEH